jgi:hypothetical protein
MIAQDKPRRPIPHSPVANAHAVLLRPILSAVIDAQDFDGIRLDAVDEDEGGDHELAGACDPTAPAAISSDMPLS